MNERKDSDPDTDSLLGRIVWGVIIFTVCCYLIRLGVSFLISVRVPLIILTLIITAGIITYRIKKWRDYHDDY